MSSIIPALSVIILLVIFCVNSVSSETSETVQAQVQAIEVERGSAQEFEMLHIDEAAKAVPTIYIESESQKSEHHISSVIKASLCEQMLNDAQNQIAGR